METLLSLCVSKDGSTSLIGQDNLGGYITLENNDKSFENGKIKIDFFILQLDAIFYRNDWNKSSDQKVVLRKKYCYYVINAI